MNKLRYCIDCKKDISNRHNRCVRCNECQKKADAANTRRRMKKKYVKDHQVTVNRTARHKIMVGGVRNPGTGKQGFTIQYLECGVNKNGEFPKKRLPFPLMKYGPVWNAETEVYSDQDKESMARHKVLVGGGEVWAWSKARKREYERITAKYAHPSARPKSDKNGYKYWKYYTDVKDKEYIEHWEEYLKRKASNDRIQHVESQRVLRQRRKANTGEKIWNDKELELLKKQKKLEKQREKKWTPKTEERRRKKEAKKKQKGYNSESPEREDMRDYNDYGSEQANW